VVFEYSHTLPTVFESRISTIKERVKMSKENEVVEIKDSEVVATKATSRKKKPNLRFQRDKDREKVKGIFKFYEVPGGQLSFSYKKYKEDQVETFTLMDGKVYTLPLGVAKHLNNNGSYPVHGYTKDETGAVSMKVGQKVRRFGFQSLEFVDVDEFVNEPSRIINVEKIY